MHVDIRYYIPVSTFSIAMNKRKFSFSESLQQHIHELWSLRFETLLSWGIHVPGRPLPGINELYLHKARRN